MSGIKGFKYIKSTGVYKASNNEFDSRKYTAISYGWWVYFTEIEGMLVFNTYKYSNATLKHQYKLRELLRQLGITGYLTINTPHSIRDYTIEQVLSTLQAELAMLGLELTGCVKAVSGKRTRIEEEITDVKERIQRVTNYKSSDLYLEKKVG